MGDPLDKLTIRGFKSIRQLEDFEFKGLNVLIGANGAGKSNLISFFRMLQAIINGNLNDYVRDSGGISDLLFNGRKATRLLDFSTRFGPRGYRFKIKPGPSEDCALIDEARYYDRGRSRWWNLGDSPDGQSLLVKEASGKSRGAQVCALDSNEQKIEKHYRKHGQLQDLFRTLLHELMTAKIRVDGLEF